MPTTPRRGIIPSQIGRHAPSTPSNSVPRTLSASSFAGPDVESICDGTPPPSTTFTPDLLAAGTASAAVAGAAATVTVTAVTATTTTTATKLAVPRPSDCGRSESVSDESFSVSDKRATNTPSTSTSSSKNNKNSRFNPLHRISAIFRESDGRCEENLRSTKRRVVQVRRQPDSAPVRFQMGFRSRTGWEPIRVTKENQDCLVALVPWGPGSRFNFFAALDGHGRHGHRCAIFIAERVVSYLKRHLVPLASHDMVANAMHRAIAYAERRLEAYEALDFSLSGSTGVFVLVHGTSLFCANVGDSRAILGREAPKGRPRRSMTHSDPDDLVSSRSRGASHPNRQYVSVPLSFDQKPMRADEKERLLACGARVDAWESIDVGEERVWLPDVRTPGLAVSRSFGDLILKPYGVNATPEVYSLELCEEDRFLVMGSDGVFEFISTEEVTEIVGRWRDNGSAQDAAEELVRCATDRWIDDDSVIDDISCVVVFMNVVAPEVATPQEPQFVQTKGGRHEPAASTVMNHNEREHSEHERRYPPDSRDVPNRTSFVIDSVSIDPSKCAAAGYKDCLDQDHDATSEHSDDDQDISIHSEESV